MRPAQLRAANRRRNGGRFANELHCDACGKPFETDDHVTDDEVVTDGSDAPGFFLCSRARCAAKREALDVEARRALYVAGRDKNEAVESRGRAK